MGLDASVRCRCFEEGKLKSGPISFSDLYIGEEGRLSSHMLDEAIQKLHNNEYNNRYSRLEIAFEEWKDQACEHEQGDYCAEHVCGWGGVSIFESLVEELGGEAEYPLLSKMLPHENDGFYPSVLAKPTLEELGRFLLNVSPEAKKECSAIEPLRNLLNASAETGNPIWWR